MSQSDPTKESGIERQLEHYSRDPLYRFTESEARELADEVLRLRDEATLGKTPSGTAIVADRVRWISEFLRENGREEMAREVERIDELRRLGEVPRMRQSYWSLQAEYDALKAERDVLREAAQALVDARTTGAKVEPWGALIAALERTK